MTDRSLPTPSCLGLHPSFGFGDRLGLATPGHLDALRGSRFAGIFAQQSIREMTRTGRGPAEVMRAAQTALAAAAWPDPWGADADHLKTEDDVARTATAGFTFFTIDPSEYVDNRADQLTGEPLAEAVAQLVATGAFESLEQLNDLYLGQTFDLPEHPPLTFDQPEPLLRAAVKYGGAVAHTARVAGWIASACAGRPYELEISVDETETATSALEHLFVGEELRRRGVRVVSLAPRFIGEFEKGIDYRGDLAAFEAELHRHVAIAKRCGPYKISVHSGSDKFRIYPILGRVCGDLLHVKTAGTSYLEALRVAARRAPALFAAIATYARSRYETDRATYHVHGQLSDVADPATLPPAECERQYLDLEAGRQILHVTFGSVLTAGQTPQGQPFKDALLELLTAEPDLHRELLATHLGRHVAGLEAG